jgi:hypothetical protein
VSTGPKDIEAWTSHVNVERQGYEEGYVQSSILNIIRHLGDDAQGKVIYDVWIKF